ncbi:WRKY transcription factor 55 [Rhododendron vialii]|uniref:WRKY transcription factor 55 n=1 Tax=Rhododendron vialii TaxID=182163 RepID=UPI00265F75F7|nr:WRKY transcription factor 55 [Rhododendron vialii]
MEEINSLIIQGCKLARFLELNLPAHSNDPGVLLKSCDEIVSVFGAARDRLNSQGSTSYAGQTSHESADIGGGMMQEWLRYGGGSQAMSLLLQAQLSADLQGRMGGTDVEGSTRFGGGGGEAQPMDVADSGGSASSSLRLRRRRNDVDKRTVMMPAPRMGNTEIPPEDGYTWRKYGQKEILGSTFPRSYYRCTHSKLYHCPAKKQVQRLDNNPFTFQVTYRGDHTCHMSSTAPSASPAPAELMPPPPPPATTQQLATTTASPPPPTTTPHGRAWLSMDFGLGSSGAGPSSGGGGAGPSSNRFGRETMEFQLPVADLADVMFNSGSSSSNSMDLIFSSGMEDKWDPGDKRSS